MNTVENKYQNLTPQQYIHRLFADTHDGNLAITYYPYNAEPPYVLNYQMDWTAKDAQDMVQRYEALATILEKLGRLRPQLETEEKRKALLTPNELQVWETFIRPFSPFDVEQPVIDELYFRAEYDSLDENENALLDRYFWWQEDTCLARMDFLRRSPTNLILHARRYEKLISWHAPQVVIEEAGRCLAEEVVLYYCGPQTTRTFPEA